MGTIYLNPFPLSSTFYLYFNIFFAPWLPCILAYRTESATPCSAEGEEFPFISEPSESVQSGDSDKIRYSGGGGSKSEDI